MTKFLLVRHALTDSVGKVLSGRSAGIHLNNEGKAQADHLGQRLSDLKIDAIYSSPLERALETASPVAETHNLSINVSDDLTEINFGSWTNKKIEELRNDSDFIAFNTLRSSTRIPDGELISEAQTRIISKLEQLSSVPENRTIVVVSHADIIKSALVWYAGIPVDLMNRIEISPACISIVELYDNNARIVCVNNCGNIL
ncbi:MAG TPA: histidine phosphatase family protein [Bacteroidales bacterium]|jgi:probable phosphoglycerate mutase|nr:histidine phosphatase family protein [Bacteroidales bacterium]